ncbi:MAG: methylglyoxal synthase [Lachnospiraceae bacterium]
MNIGLIAHNSKKELMINFCIAYKSILTKHTLYATGTTGHQLRDIVGLNVYCFLPGHLGGDRQMGAQIECNQIDAMIFLRDPLRQAEKDADFSLIIRLCDSNNIPVATNLASAELLIIAVNRGDLEWRNLY